MVFIPYARSRGAALVTALVVLIAVLIVAVSAATAALNAEKSARNERDRHIALQAAEAALADARRGERVREGYRIVLIGETNAGKSSLFNALVEREAAIVTPIAGTTRDVLDADLVIGAVLVPGAAAPKLVTRAMLKLMTPGTVMCDVAIDQGGCFETSHPTTHADPTFVVDGVIHYCVANMPGAVARTSTFALNSVTLPFTLALADKGWKQALVQDPYLRDGLNVCEGKLTCEPVAEAHGLPYTSAESVLGL